MASLRRVVVETLGSMRAAHSRRGLAAWHTRSQPMRNSPGQRRGRAAVESAEAQARGKSTQHVRSFFVAASIDVDDLLRRLPSHWLRKTGKNSAMLTLKAADRTVPDAAAQGNTIPWEDSHVSVFQRGAMVFLNCDFPTYLEVFNLVKKANHSAVRPEYGEDCMVEVNPEFPAWSALEGEVLRVQVLDLDNIAVLNSVMGQTVILDYYERQVDSMLDTVQELNRAIENKDTSKLKADHLYNALTRVNDISIQVIMSGLRNKFRPGTAAWKEEKYFTMQQTLWEQYELEERYEQLEGKVTYINDVIKYCLEVQKENKFLRLERMIVYLITIELFVSLLHTPGVLDTLAEWWATIRTALAA